MIQHSFSLVELFLMFILGPDFTLVLYLISWVLFVTVI
jgi:hypothetical protein